MRMAVPPEAPPNSGLFRHSDVIAFTRGSLDDYRSYHVSFVSWGGYLPTHLDAKQLVQFDVLLVPPSAVLAPEDAAAAASSISP
jgi:hypothetical protein